MAQELELHGRDNILAKHCHRVSRMKLYWGCTSEGQKRNKENSR
jgi:hypothetical protein